MRSRVSSPRARPRLRSSVSTLVLDALPGPASRSPASGDEQLDAARPAEIDLDLRPPPPGLMPAVRALGGLYFKALHGIEHRGAEHCPSSGPLIVTANHPT